jgi:hypothetical protein
MLDQDGWERRLWQAASGAESRPQHIAELCVQTLDVTGAGISMLSNTGTRSVIWATDAVSAKIEDLQVTLGEGPCVDATRSGGPVLVDDLHERGDLATARWPTFLAAADEAGVRAVFAFPLQIGAVHLGALDMYRVTPGALGQEFLSAALLAAQVSALTLLGLQSSDEVGLADHIDGDTYQAQVHQATGMVMAQLDVTIEEAFVLLRARAFASDRPLLAVAIDVVERRLRFTPEDS